jgi:hypothetical protein
VGKGDQLIDTATSSHLKELSQNRLNPNHKKIKKLEDRTDMSPSPLSAVADNSAASFAGKKNREDYCVVVCVLTPASLPVSFEIVQYRSRSFARPGIARK